MTRLFDTSGFPPRWNCGTGWTPFLGWLHIFSDLGIWSAYLAIPCVLSFFVWRRRDLPFRTIFLLFGAFILACGTTHLLEAIIFWWPIYRFAGVVKCFTAIVSWTTVFAMVPIVPEVLQLRSPNELEREIKERKKVEAELREMQGRLEQRVAERTAELAQANTALRLEMNERSVVSDNLRKQHGWLRVTLASIADGVIATDQAGRISLMNRCAEQLTGWGSLAAAERPLEEVFQEVDADGVASEANPIRQALQAGSNNGVPRAARIRHRDGSERAIEETATPILSDADEIIGAVMVFHDISERLRAEQALRDSEQRERERASELERAVQEVRNADRRKDEFLAMLSHELRNPLAPLRNALLIVKQMQHEPETLQWAVEMMERQIENLVRLVDDLLDVSRITRGKIELKRAPIELQVLVERAVEIAKPLIDEQRHTLEIALPPTPIWLDVDAVRMAQALANVLNNAAKYTEAGGAISISAEADDQGATLRFQDNGVGIDAALLPHVFDLFTQADHSLERSKGGLGIGLTLVRSLIEMHGGSVHAYSDGLGHGSEFVIRLPRIGAPRPLPEQAALAAPAPGRRVLVVEDNVGAATILARLLQMVWSHQVEVAHDGTAAIALAQSFQPEVVLCDLGLPGISGCEVARELRKLPGGERWLLVALTGYGEEKDRAQTAAAGFDQHLVKPPGVEQLRELFIHPKINPTGAAHGESTEK
ncbi:MAG TPA: ATP-binding protein [Pirellulales bacterium]|nr:ATP-binding protein [Pirellulales bacterium]